MLAKIFEHLQTLSRVHCDAQFMNVARDISKISAVMIVLEDFETKSRSIQGVWKARDKTYTASRRNKLI